MYIVFVIFGGRGFQKFIRKKFRKFKVALTAAVSSGEKSNNSHYGNQDGDDGK